MIKQYKYNNKIYSVVYCTKEDIPFHLERVYPYLDKESTEVEDKLRDMTEAVDTNTAYKLVDSDNNLKAMLYFKPMKELQAIGIAAWFSSYKMFAILMTYIRKHTYNRHFYFGANTFIQFASIVTHSSILAYHAYGTHLEVDLISAEGRRLTNLYNKMKVETING